MRIELENTLTLARTLSLPDLPEFMGGLEQIRCIAFARIMASVASLQPDILLDVAQASERLHVSENYLYRHSHRLPFTRRVGRKLLFSSSGLDAYLRKAR
jgi:excisionase family DNA binding protein